MTEEGTAVGTETPRLSEQTVKQALTRLDWTLLKNHLDSLNLAADEGKTLAALLGHVRRASGLIVQHKNPQTEQRRDALLDALGSYLAEHLGTSARAQLEQEATLLRLAEHGYRSILAMLEEAEISRLSPDVRIAAYIGRSAIQFALSMKQAEDALTSGSQPILPGPMAMAKEGTAVSPDDVLSLIVKCLTLTLLMEGHRNRWFDERGHLVLPSLSPTDDAERYKAGSTELLAINWMRWRRTEERRRFLGGEFQEITGEALPVDAPPQIARMLVYNGSKDEIFDYLANERRKDHTAQTLIALLLEAELDWPLADPETERGLLPCTCVSRDEAYAAIVLSETLGWSILEDENRPGGLRLVEWLRGYSVLQEVARERGGKGYPFLELYPSIPRGGLLTLLSRSGLSSGAAEAFVDAATFGRESRDLFDCPLISTADGSILLSGPALINLNLAEAVLSSLSTVGEPLSRRGKAFERNVLDFLRKSGLRAEAFKVNRGGVEFEYDSVAVWGSYVFVLECKSHGLSQHSPVQAYYFAQMIRSGCKQVKRLAAALSAYPDILSERFGLDVSSVTIVPCLLNALPFSMPERDGVLIFDASALKRFFSERYIHIKVSHRLSRDVQVIHRTAMYSQWDGAEPSPVDLLREMREPFQMRLLSAHTRIAFPAFAIGPTEAVAPSEFGRVELTVESFAKFVGVSAGSVRQEIARVARRTKAARQRLGKVGDGKKSKARRKVGVGKKAKRGKKAKVWKKESKRARRA